MIHTTANSGLHSHVAERVLSRYARAGMRAVDLGTGPGAMAMRLQSLGCDVVGVDRDTNGFHADLPHVALDLDESTEPTHISPVFWDLFGRQFLPRASVKLREHFVFPPNGYQLTRTPIAFALRLLATFSPGDSVLGDNHVLVIERAS